MEVTAGVCVALGAPLGLLYLVKRYISGARCTSQARLDGKTVIITGANTGIGKETAIDLARRGGRVILACRSVERGETAAREVREKSGSDNVVFRQLDLASLASVRHFSTTILEEETRIDILVNNAGVWMGDHEVSEDGFEMHFAVNHLGHFLLTNLLLDRIKAAPAGRIINVSALLYRFCKGISFDDINFEQSYSAGYAYRHSKLANILFTRELARRLEGSNVTVNALHPGVIQTELSRHTFSKFPHFLLPAFQMLFGFFVKTAWEGAQTTIHCAVSEEMEGVSGQYVKECCIQTIRRPGNDDDMATRLWEISLQMAGLECISVHTQATL